MDEPEVVRRALAIAPECGSMAELKRRLIHEGYVQVNAQLSDWHIRRLIRDRLNPDLAQEVPKQVRRLPPIEG